MRPTRRSLSRHSTLLPRPAALLVVGATLGCAGPFAPAAEPEEPSELYVMGAMVGGGFVRLGLDEAEAQEMARGFADGVLARPGIEDPSAESLERVQEFTKARLDAQVQFEQRDAEAVLAAAAREEGAVVHDSGLILTVIDPGQGDPPETLQFVTLDFHGTLRDGTVFLSTRDSEPRVYRLGTMIRCWQEALAQVAPGAVLRVVCPAGLAFGDEGFGLVPGGAVVAFDVELLAVSDEP